MEAVGTWPRPMIAISGRCFRMIATPVSREFVFQRTSNEPIVRPRMSMCRIASWSVSMIRQLMRFISPLLYKMDYLGPARTTSWIGGRPRTFQFHYSCHNGSLVFRYVLNPDSHEGHRLDHALSWFGRIA